MIISNLIFYPFSTFHSFIKWMLYLFIFSHVICFFHQVFAGFPTGDISSIPSGFSSSRSRSSLSLMKSSLTEIIISSRIRRSSFSALKISLTYSNLEQLIGLYPESKDVYRERSPLFHSDRITYPIISLQGLEDRIVPPEQTENIVDSLMENKLSVAYLSFEGDNTDSAGQVVGYKPLKPSYISTVNFLESSRQVTSQNYW